MKRIVVAYVVFTFGFYPMVDARTVSSGEVFYSESYIEVDPSNNGNELIVEAHGAVETPSAFIVGSYGGYFTEVTVAGTNALLQTGAQYVGNGGRGIDYSIENGGIVRCSSFSLSGDQTQGVVYSYLINHLSVSGQGSLLDVAGNLDLWSPESPGAPGLPFELPREIPCYAEVSGGGTVSVDSLSVANGSWFRLGEGGHLHVENDFNVSTDHFLFDGGTLSVGGKVSGRLKATRVSGGLTLAGTYALDEEMSACVVDGSLTISSEGVLEVAAGYAANGHLTVEGLAVLEGSLEVLFTGDAPVYGARYDLFDWNGGVSGQFVAITAPQLVGGLFLDSSELYTTGSVSVIPEPATLSLMGMASSGLFWARRIRRRRRFGRSVMPVEGLAMDRFFEEPVSSGPVFDDAAPRANLDGSLKRLLDGATGRFGAVGSRFVDALMAWDRWVDLPGRKRSLRHARKALASRGLALLDAVVASVAWDRIESRGRARRRKLAAIRKRAVSLLDAFLERVM
ncbi:PEP-CTERM sorting domain-containing protein [Pontiella desulfatans]|nr:PEP-CTERM sorting domain-containing protein [Pontiella desulfatans]